MLTRQQKLNTTLNDSNTTPTQLETNNAGQIKKSCLPSCCARRLLLLLLFIIIDDGERICAFAMPLS